MLYTGKGDKGDTNLFGCCSQRISKSAPVIEALGAVDELNSLLGVLKIKTDPESGKILNQVQQNLFIIQAELAGSEKTINREKETEVDEIVNQIEKKLPPIKSFIIPGGTEASALCDYARAVARRAERRVVGAAESGAKIGEFSLAYLNRLSSLLYALARLENQMSDIKEEPPRYE